MAKTKSFVLTTETGYAVTVDVNKKNYTVSTIAGEIGTFPLKGGFFLQLEGDIPITVNDKQYIVAVRGKSVRLAADGKYLDNGQVFKPSIEPPKWVIVFYILNFAVCIIALGGAIPFLIAFTGIICCAKVSKTTMPTPAKVGICCLITVAVWVLFLGLLLASAGVMYS